MIKNLRILFFLMLFFCFKNSVANNQDTLKLSLLTCSPHTEVYSLYGHTALRYQDLSAGVDMAVNYGVFNFNSDNFVLNFVLGLTDYEMDIIPFNIFCDIYQNRGSSVVEQELNLTQKEIANIISAIKINALPENRVYRYNYFYDNCTSRARNMILNNMEGKVEYKPSNIEITYRELIHKYTNTSRWAQFGNDMLLGIGADKQITQEQQQFIPANLMGDFATATIKNADGSIKPLIKNTFEISPLEAQSHTKPSFFLTPFQCFLIFFFVTLMITLIEIRKKKYYYGYDLLLFFLQAIVGLLLIVMIFSKHPTVQTNLQLLLFNPLSLIFSYFIIKNGKKRKAFKLLYLQVLLIIAFFLGNFIQSYAEGTNLIALTFLVRYVMLLLNRR